MRGTSVLRRVAATAAVGLVVASGVGAAPSMSGASAALATAGNAVTEWNEIAQNAVVVGRPVGSALVLEGIAQAAIYDATVAIEGGYEPFVATPTVDHPASTAAAIAEAARDVLVDLVDDVGTQVPYVEAQYSGYMAMIPDGPAKTNGIDVGDQVSQAILSWRAGDGFDNVVDYEQIKPSPGPGVFEPFPPPTPVDVKLMQVRPLTLTSNSQFRPDRPNPLTSAAYAEDFNEVKAYGSIDSAVRTPEQTEIARFWAANTAIQWPSAERALAVEKALGLAETARMLALAQVATADALLGCFDAKYHYFFWRPRQAIPNADMDGNPATEADPNWTPLLNVNHPEYPGAHGCGTTAVTRAMAAFFGTDKVTFSVDSGLTGTTRHFDSFRDAAKEVYDARTWAGLHFRNSTMEGAWIGRKVAHYVVANFFMPTVA
jgi:hypothetical protein